MIELTGEPGDKNPKIRFKPRPGFKQTHEVIERELIYGHKCIYCDNVVQALFLTDEPIDLWPYEETNIMSTGKSAEKAGTVLEVVPNQKSDPGYTNYTVTHLRSSGAPGQHIVLKNHVLKYHGIEAEKNGTDRYFEPGKRPCTFTGAFALSDDILIRDVCLFMRMSYLALNQYNIPTMQEFLEAISKGDYAKTFKAIPAYGDAPPVILFPRERMTTYYGYQWEMQKILAGFEKPKGTAAESVLEDIEF